ncbi:PA14 domain-containing protein [Spirosoma areae]
MRPWRKVILLSLWLAGSGAWAQKTRPAASLQAGLKGEYFSGPNFERKVMTRTDADVNFNWNWESPGPGVPREYFSVRWTGKLYAPTSGTYRFSATVDDGVRVWVGGKNVINEWRKQDDSQFVGEISLNGKQLYDLRIEYYNDWKGSVISVFWESPDDRRLFSFASKPHQVIPAKYLFSKPDRPLPKPPVAAKQQPAPLPVLPVATTRPAPKPSTPKLPALKPVSTLAKRKTDSVATTPAKLVQKPAPLLATVVPGVAAPAPPAEPSFGKLKAGDAMVLQHVVFAQSDYTLLPESCAELDKLVRALQASPALRVEIAGHTDNIGDKRLNQALSEFRAKVVASYLIRHGIADARITAKGYGGSRPLADNTSEAQRAQNRRVEFIVNN